MNDINTGITISHSSNNKYLECPFAWYLHYMLRLRESTKSSAFIFGTAVGDAFNAIVKNKFQDEKIDPVELFDSQMRHTDINGVNIDLIDCSKVKFWKSDLDLSIWNDDDHKLGKTYCAEWVSLRRKGLMMIDAYTNYVLPHLTDLLDVQKYFKIVDDSNTAAIIGYIDLIAKFKYNDAIDSEVNPELKKFDNKFIVFDDKTTSSFSQYKPDCVATSKQLGTYIEAPSLPEDIEYAGYIVLNKNFRTQKKPTVPLRIIIDNVKEDTVKSVFESYADTIANIKQAKFQCTQNCNKGPFKCPYLKYCESGLTDLTGLEFVPK